MSKACDKVQEGLTQALAHARAGSEDLASIVVKFEIDDQDNTVAYSIVKGQQMPPVIHADHLRGKKVNSITRTADQGKVLYTVGLEGGHVWRLGSENVEFQKVVVDF